MSLLEMSHRGEVYERVHREDHGRSSASHRAPDDFEVLLLQGGATLQFSMVPLNLLGGGARADYVLTGSWSRKALADACGTAMSPPSGNRVRSRGGSRPGRSRCRPESGYLHSPRTRPSTKSNGGPSPTSVCRWWLTCRRITCPGRSLGSVRSRLRGTLKNLGPEGLTVGVRPPLGTRLHPRGSGLSAPLRHSMLRWRDWRNTPPVAVESGLLDRCSPRIERPGWNRRDGAPDQ